MKQKQKALRGVNLGGWLILEKWMTPSVFAGTDANDEYSLSQVPGGHIRIEKHRERFITEDDFVWLAQHNVELVRIPFGYWLFDDEGLYVGGAERLDWAMEMAEKYGIKVLLDLHALPGSQNGNDHSGRTGSSEWFHDVNHRKRSLKICVEVARRYKDSPVLWGFEVINEPEFGWRMQRALRRYYTRAYRELLQILPDHVYVVFSDAFRPWLLAGALWDNRKQRVAMDVHWYSSGLNWQRFRTVEDYYQAVHRRRWSLWFFGWPHPVIVGEWSAMLDKGAVGKTGDLTLHVAEESHLREQLSVYQYALAHVYWSYKTEHEGAWNYRYLTEKGVIRMTDSATLDV